MERVFSHEVEGAHLHVVVNGSDQLPTILLWPPGRCNLHVWDHLVPKLISRFQVIRIDPRGMGRSVVHNSNEHYFTFDQYSDDACCVLDHLNIEKCHIWSQSWGTRAATVFAATKGIRVLSAALYAANIDTADVPAQRQGTKEAAEIRKQLGIPTEELGDVFLQHLDPEMATLTTSAAGKYSLRECIPHLECPVLIATGSHDPNLKSSREILEIAPNAQLVELENVGHNAILEHPALALSTYLDFYDALKF